MLYAYILTLKFSSKYINPNYLFYWFECFHMICPNLSSAPCICPWRPEFWTERKNFASGNSLFFYFLGMNKKQRSCDGRGAAQRPVLHVFKPKKTGAHSARALMRGLNPLLCTTVLGKITRFLCIVHCALQLGCLPPKMSQEVSGLQHAVFAAPGRVYLKEPDCTSGLQHAVFAAPSRVFLYTTRACASPLLAFVLLLEVSVPGG
jgi:hypothetical protein